MISSIWHTHELHVTLAFLFVGVIANSRAPLLHGHYAASLLLRARPPPSRLPPFSWVRQLYGFLASATFMTGRGGLLQLLNMSLVGIELGRADVKVKGYQSRPFGCEMGSQFHQHHVSRGPPIMPDGGISQVRFEVLAFRP